ncbi:DNA starvation/stationary phase protection protein [Radiobacillus kanasensis]|uniref:Dps family protein n=1 Tax=Radiobacillus kanasensis TaxID=2844358 RepID=UPI001E571AF0|nr:DNA starvation/stationary phase protection protein [Radiobacillus kanasensis]UFU01112.1 DNA starvation/stationary phase protection protein [Radiobacillus kanasensis]
MQENQKLINFLNQELSNFAVLYVKLHRYHWFVQGRHFFKLHEVFEELYNETASDLDNVAERILAIGGKPLATMHKYIKEATLQEAQADDKENEIIHQLSEDYRTIIKEIKEIGFPLAEEQKDQPTVDILNELQGRFEKHVWMLQAYTAYE